MLGAVWPQSSLLQRAVARTLLLIYSKVVEASRPKSSLLQRAVARRSPDEPLAAGAAQQLRLGDRDLVDKEPHAALGDDVADAVSEPVCQSCRMYYKMRRSMSPHTTRAGTISRLA